MHYTTDSHVEALLAKRTSAHQHHYASPLPPSTDDFTGRLVTFRKAVANKRVDDKISKLKRTVRRNHKAGLLKMHRTVWCGEVGKLDGLRTSLETSIHTSLINLVQLCDPNAQDDVAFLADVEGAVGSVEEMEGARRIMEEEIYNSVMSAVELRKQLGAREVGKREMEVWRERVGEVKEFLRDINDEILYKSRNLPTMLTKTSLLSPYSSAEEIDIRNPWIEHDGKVIRFLELTCLDKEVEKRRWENYWAQLREYDSKQSAASDDDAPCQNHIELTPQVRYHLRKLQDEYRHSHLPNQWTLCIDRIRMEVPGYKSKTREEIGNILTTLHQSPPHPQPLNLTHFITETLHLFQTANQHHLRTLHLTALKNQHLLSLTQSRQKVSEWKHETEERRRDYEAELHRLRKEEEERMRNEEEKRRLEREAREMEIRRYREEKKKKVLESIEVGRRLEEELQGEILERMKHNKSRTNHRAHLHTLTLAHKSQLTLEALQAQQSLEARLLALAQSVAPQVAPSLDRATSETLAFKNAKSTPGEQKPFGAIVGFTAQDWYKDKRARLSEELWRRGLSGNAYARGLICGMVREERRGDLKSGIKFG